MRAMPTIFTCETCGSLYRVKEHVITDLGNGTLTPNPSGRLITGEQRVRDVMRAPMRVISKMVGCHGVGDEQTLVETLRHRLAIGDGAHSAHERFIVLVARRRHPAGELFGRVADRRKSMTPMTALRAVLDDIGDCDLAFDWLIAGLGPDRQRENL